MSHASPLPSDRKTGHVRSGDMPRSLVWLFALASGLSVANVYYAQPLLDALSRDFGISHVPLAAWSPPRRLAVLWLCCSWFLWAIKWIAGA